MEDDFTYVIRKALRGLSLAPGDAATRAGLAEPEVMGLIRGKFSADAARRLAPVLSLNAEALARLPDYEPKPMMLTSVERLDIPFEDGQVNAWALRVGGIVVLFDAGFSDASIALALDAAGISKIDAIFITHDHRDHVGGLHEVLRRGPRQSMHPGASVALGPLTIHAFDLSGHCDDSLGYLIEGLEKPVCVVGDALFAGSIGGCPPEAYQSAIARLRQGVFSLSDETLLLPGHGPATTVGEERVSNPFFP